MTVSTLSYRDNVSIADMVRNVSWNSVKALAQFVPAAKLIALPAVGVATALYVAPAIIAALPALLMTAGAIAAIALIAHTSRHDCAGWQFGPIATKVAHEEGTENAGETQPAPVPTATNVADDSMTIVYVAGTGTFRSCQQQYGRCLGKIEGGWEFVKNGQVTRVVRA